jgi:hypothetical protein
LNVYIPLHWLFLKPACHQVLSYSQWRYGEQVVVLQSSTSIGSLSDLWYSLRQHQQLKSLKINNVFISQLYQINSNISSNYEGNLKMFPVNDNIIYFWMTEPITGIHTVLNYFMFLCCMKLTFNINLQFNVKVIIIFMLKIW